MARHLKTEIISSLDRIVSEYVILPANSAPRARGVRYLTFVEGIDAYFGMMNSHKEGRHYRKHIIARRRQAFSRVFLGAMTPILE